MSEFNLIERYFYQKTDSKQIALGIGDDAAVVNIPAGKQVVIAMDTLVEGVHFLADYPAQAIAHLALAVNFSDLAAMGVAPSWFTLSITLPENNHEWLQPFSQGLFSLANQYHVALIGGDVSKGHLSITITVNGLTQNNQFITRHQAQVGDKIYVSGHLGAAAVAIEQLKQHQQINDGLRNALYYPQPQIELGQALLGRATAAIDISDGLAADLHHILQASSVGATIYIDQLPIDPLIHAYEHAWRYALTGGDDYQLCFTAPAEVELKDLPVAISQIGEITEQPGLRCVDQSGHAVSLPSLGFNHFLKE